MRSVSEMYGPRSRSLTYSVRISGTLAVTKRSTSAVVSASFALASTSPVDGSATSWREDLALEVLDRDVQALDARFLELAHVARRDAAPFLHDDLAVRADLEHRDLAAQALGHELELGPFLVR